ncbi:MAG: serine hydrolase [Saprospiraceae bacterium]|nr:serine hydrolase [Saprospiraceae bacterium]
MKAFLINISKAGYLLLILLFLNACTSSTPREELEKAIHNIIDHGGGTFAVAWKNLETGEELLINADTVFHAASTMKTPVMIEVFKQVNQGLFKLDDSLLIKNSFYSIIDSSSYSLSPEEDSETDLYTKTGQKLPISDLIYRMIIRSSNLATNIVIDLVDARKVTQTMRELGANQIQVLRGVEDMKAYEAGRNNTTTARDLLIIFENLAYGTFISKEANEQMIDILFDQQFNEMIPAELPPTVKVAHKTGSITGVHHDSGIVFLPDGKRYVLILMSKDLQDFEHGTKALAHISGLIYQYIMDDSQK